MASPSGEAAETLASTTSKWRLGREVWAALLRVRICPECPEGNLSELTWASKTRLWDSYHPKSPKTLPDPCTEQSTEQN